jgi:hypothetical protein
MCDRNMHTPRYVIDAFFTKDPKPFSAIVSNMGLLRATEATRALNTIGGHFKQHAMQNFSDCDMTVRKYQSLIDMMSN